jgi:hypothetical protein
MHGNPRCRLGLVRNMQSEGQMDGQLLLALVGVRSFVLPRRGRNANSSNDL